MVSWRLNLTLPSYINHCGHLVTLSCDITATDSSCHRPSTAEERYERDTFKLQSKLDQAVFFGDLDEVHHFGPRAFESLPSLLIFLVFFIDLVIHRIPLMSRSMAKLRVIWVLRPSMLAERFLLPVCPFSTNFDIYFIYKLAPEPT